MLFIYILVAIGLTSCKKELYPSSTKVSANHMDAEKKGELAKVRNWYESYQKQTGNKGWLSSSTNKQVFTDNNLIGMPYWDESIFYRVESDTTDYLMTPLINPEFVNYSFSKDMSPNGFRSLLFSEKTKNVDYSLFIVELHPDDSYLAQKRRQKGFTDVDLNRDYLLVKFEDYTGYYLIYNNLNRLIYGERRENGLTVNRLIL